jgi:hypothetical protein
VWFLNPHSAFGKITVFSPPDTAFDRVFALFTDTINLDSVATDHPIIMYVHGVELRGQDLSSTYWPVCLTTGYLYFTSMHADHELRSIVRHQALMAELDH